LSQLCCLAEQNSELLGAGFLRLGVQTNGPLSVYIPRSVSETGSLIWPHS
jgi:hypothetical protein